MATRAQFRHEDVATVPRGWKVRTVTQRTGHQVRVAYPPGPRRKGAGRLISILHPQGENPAKCGEGRRLKAEGRNPRGTFIEGAQAKWEKLTHDERRKWLRSVGADENWASSFDLYGDMPVSVSMKLTKSYSARGNPRGKIKTREQVEKMQAKAVKFLRDVVKDDDKADEIEALSLDDYAAKKKITLGNPQEKPIRTQDYLGEKRFGKPVVGKIYLHKGNRVRLEEIGRDGKVFVFRPEDQKSYWTDFHILTAANPRERTGAWQDVEFRGIPKSARLPGGSLRGMPPSKKRKSKSGNPRAGAQLPDAVYIVQARPRGSKRPWVTIAKTKYFETARTEKARVSGLGRDVRVKTMWPGRRNPQDLRAYIVPIHPSRSEGKWDWTVVIERKSDGAVLRSEKVSGGRQVAEAYARQFLKELQTGNPRRRRNQAQDAEALYRKFHGKAPKEVLELQESAAIRGEYTSLGDLVELVVKSPAGDSLRIGFEGEKVKLASSPNGGQLYFLGGNQALDGTLSRFKTDATKDLVDLGEAQSIVYRAAKDFTGFKSSDWEHAFGEESGERPSAFYDKLKRRIFLVGGTYRVERPGIVD